MTTAPMKPRIPVSTAPKRLSSGLAAIWSRRRVRPAARESVPSGAAASVRGGRAGWESGVWAMGGAAAAAGVGAVVMGPRVRRRRRFRRRGFCQGSAGRNKPGKRGWYRRLYQSYYSVKAWNMMCLPCSPSRPGRRIWCAGLHRRGSEPVVGQYPAGMTTASHDRSLEVDLVEEGLGGEVAA